MKIGQRLRMCGLIAAYMSLFIPWMCCICKVLYINVALRCLSLR
jgi:hypothetical protein